MRAIETRRLRNTLLNILCAVAFSANYFPHVAAVSPESHRRVVAEFNTLLSNIVDSGGLFDHYGSIDAAVWTKDASGEVLPVYQRAFGMAQYKRARDHLGKIDGEKPSPGLKTVVDNHLDDHPDIPALNDEKKRNIYRIASNTKSFIGVAAFMIRDKYGLDLDEKISPKYIDLSMLGEAHGWNHPTIDAGFTDHNFPNSTRYSTTISFRHLLSHTAGLSRESRCGDQYPYASSRTHTPICPNGNTPCDPNIKENNWEVWTENIIKYMMPACGYEHYPEKSTRGSCLPGEYFHYSNAGYSLLGYALESYLKQRGVSESLTTWISDNIFARLNMSDTAFTWTDLSKQQKLRTVTGCAGGEATCDNKLPITDFADHGIKTPPGGIWSTTTDIAKFLLSLDRLNLSSEIYDSDPYSAEKDIFSEEEPEHMPWRQFSYGYGFYVSKNYTCSAGCGAEHFQGAWGSVPGYTSYTITNPRPTIGQIQYAVVILRSYNYAGRLNIGNQARRLLWRLLHPTESASSLRCPVLKLDDYSEGDVIEKDTRSC